MFLNPGDPAARWREPRVSLSRKDRSTQTWQGSGPGRRLSRYLGAGALSALHSPAACHEASYRPCAVQCAPEQPRLEDSVGPALGGMKDEGS